LIYEAIKKYVFYLIVWLEVKTGEISITGMNRRLYIFKTALGFQI